MRPQGKIDPNNLKVSLVPLTLLCGTYPLAKNRSDMGCEEYTRYKMDWERFEYIWAYTSSFAPRYNNTSVFVLK